MLYIALTITIILILIDYAYSVYGMTKLINKQFQALKEQDAYVKYWKAQRIIMESKTKQLNAIQTKRKK